MPLRVPDLREMGERWRFEREIVTLIEGGHTARAEYLVREAMAVHGSARLAEAVEAAPREAPAIDGWEEISADLAQADAALMARAGVPSAAVRLALVNRDTVPQLEIERQFTLGDLLERSAWRGGAPNWRPEYQRRAPVRILGLERLMAVQREASVPGNAGREVDKSLAGLVLLIRYHQLIAACVDYPGLSRAIPVLIDVEQVDRPMEEGVYDYGPVAQRLVGAHQGEAMANAAAEIGAERAEENARRYQDETANSISELREIFRLLAFFPFYRPATRHKVADIFDAQLRTMHGARDLPGKPPRWSDGKAAIESLFAAYVATKGVADPGDALDPRHVDALHARWVATAKACDFNLPRDNILSMFALMLTYALTFGGPIVQDRWVHAKPYDPAR
jgi:hypothetical protein